MPSTDFNDSGRREYFATTHWSVVLAAANTGKPEAQAALETLCRGYWFPLYAFIRRDGYGAHEAQDLTQEFLARLIEKRQLAGIEAGRGKFRSFLLVTLRHFLSDERKRTGAQKRGGDRVIISIDETAAESRYPFELVDSVTPEVLFEREWALTVLDKAMERLRRRYAKRGRSRLFDELEICLGGGKNDVSYAAIASRLDSSEGAIKVAVHRLRKEFGDALRAEIAQTVANPSEIDVEICQLIAATSR